MSVIHLTRDNFNQEVLETTDQVLVDFLGRLVRPLQDPPPHH